MDNQQNSIYAISPGVFKACLTGSVILINLFVVMIAGLAAYQSRDHDQDQARINTRNISNVLEQTIVSKIEKTDLMLLSVLNEIDEMQTTAGIDEQALGEHIKQLRSRMPFIDSSKISDNRGNVFLGLEPGQNLNLSLIHISEPTRPY